MDKDFRPRHVLFPHSPYQHLHSPAGTCWSIPPCHMIFQFWQEPGLPFFASSSSWPVRQGGGVRMPAMLPLSGQLLGEAEKGSPGSCQNWKIMWHGEMEQQVPPGEWGYW